MGLGDADKGLRLGPGQAFFEVFDAYAGIDYHRHRTSLEYGKGQGEEFQAGFDHEGSAYALPYPDLFESVGNVIAFSLQLLKGILRVAYPAIPVPAPGKQDGRFVGLPCRHERQVRSNIDKFRCSHDLFSINNVAAEKPLLQGPTHRDISANLFCKCSNVAFMP